MSSPSDSESETGSGATVERRAPSMSSADYIATVTSWTRAFEVDLGHALRTMIENYECVLYTSTQPDEREIVRTLHALKTHRANHHDVGSFLPLLAVYGYHAHGSRQGIHMKELSNRLEHIFLFVNMLYPSLGARSAGHDIYQALVRRSLRAVLRPAAPTAPRCFSLRRCRSAPQSAVSKASPRPPWR